jgi:hypothetical protein
MEVGVKTTLETDLSTPTTARRLLALRNMDAEADGTEVMFDREYRVTWIRPTRRLEKFLSQPSTIDRANAHVESTPRPASASRGGKNDNKSTGNRFEE